MGPGILSVSKTQRNMTDQHLKFGDMYAPIYFREAQDWGPADPSLADDGRLVRKLLLLYYGVLFAGFDRHSLPFTALRRQKVREGKRGS